MLILFSNLFIINADCFVAKVELIDTTNGMFMSRKEAVLMGLSGSAILCGVK